MEKKLSIITSILVMYKTFKYIKIIKRVRKMGFPQIFHIVFQETLSRFSG